MEARPRQFPIELSPVIMRKLADLQRVVGGDDIPSKAAVIRSLIEKEHKAKCEKSIKEQA